MKRNLFTTAALLAAIAGLSLAGCSKDNGDGPETEPGEKSGERLITLTAALPNQDGTAGNGGTLAYAVSPENAADPNYEINLFKKTANGTYTDAFSLRGSGGRTSRVQGSDDGKYLYNIQYSGPDGGVFNKYKVSGGTKYEEVGSELNTQLILGNAPRWVKAAEGIGVGVYYGEALPSYKGTPPNHQYQHPKGTIRMAIIDLNNTAITNTGTIDVDLGAELEGQGYYVWRADVPVINQAKTKIFIGLGIRRHDLNNNALVTNRDGSLSWPRTNERDLGTVTYVVDYPSLRNPKIIISKKAMTDNLSYRTMTQYVGDDGHIYQAATSFGVGHQILRISKTTNDYDDAYDFNLNTALGIDDAGIRAFRYIKDGVGVVLYTRSGTSGGYIALVDLSKGTATKLSTEKETDSGFSGTDTPDVTGTFEQFQNIGLAGDYVYVPMTPNSKDGNIYVINWKTKQVKKGAKLVNRSGSFFIGAY